MFLKYAKNFKKSFNHEKDKYFATCWNIALIPSAADYQDRGLRTELGPIFNGATIQSTASYGVRNLSSIQLFCLHSVLQMSYLYHFMSTRTTHKDL